MPAHPEPGFPGEFLTQGAETAGDGLTDLGGEVLLDEAVASDRVLLLVGGRAAELAVGASQDRVQLSVEEQRGQIVVRQPPGAGSDDLRHARP